MTREPQAADDAPEAEFDFDQAMRQLEQIADEMDRGELSLAQLQAHFEEGMRLAKLCEQKLTEVEQRIELLTTNEEGEIARKPFQLSPSDAEDDDKDLPL